MSQQEAFKVEHRGFIATAFYAQGQDADIVVTREGALYKEFKYPAYRIWNIAAHWRDMVEEVLAREP